MSAILTAVLRLRAAVLGGGSPRRIEALRALGVRIGERVALPASTWIDESHGFLISIGDDCGFGERCMILAHDAQMNQFVNATRIGRVIIHPSSHIGAGTTILPGVEIGPRTVVGAGSVVLRSLPHDTVCTGNPARVVSTLADYVAHHRAAASKRPAFPYREFGNPAVLTLPERDAMRGAVADVDGYIRGASWDTPEPCHG